jgi:hypothetical protein
LAGTGNTIRSNSIFANGGLGIDLGTDVVTVNDDGDGDTGPNNLQNFPVLSVVPSQTGHVITADLNSTPNATYTIEFFSNDQCDESGHGEGMTLHGTATLTTDNSGNGSVTPSTAGAILPGTVFTATATDEDGSTSEFSRCVSLVDFSVAIAPSSRTVTAGESTTYDVTVAAEGGEFSETVSLSCAGLPEEATCSFSDSEVIPGSGEVTSTMTVQTGPPTKTLVSAGVNGAGAALALACLLVLIALAALSPVCTRNGLRLSRWGRTHTLLALVAVLLLMTLACGDDDTTSPTGGTPSGTYQLTVTGTWDSVERSAGATLLVE